MPFLWSQVAATTACLVVQYVLNSSSDMFGFRCCMTVNLRTRSLVAISSVVALIFNDLYVLFGALMLLMALSSFVDEKTSSSSSSTKGSWFRAVENMYVDACGKAEHIPFSAKRLYAASSTRVRYCQVSDGTSCRLAPMLILGVM
jgi:hypothetical protein